MHLQRVALDSFSMLNIVFTFFKLALSLRDDEMSNLIFLIKEAKHTAYGWE